MGFASDGGWQRRRTFIEAVLLCALLSQILTAFMADVHAEDGEHCDEGD